MANNKHEIHQRIYVFVLRVLSAIRQFPKSTENSVLIRQIVRSSGSIGANASEADAAESKKEFIQQFTIAKKEAKETLYWLNLLFNHNKVPKQRTFSLLDENQQIVAIISKIILNAKK